MKWGVVMNEQEAIEDLMRHRQGSAREVERLKNAGRDFSHFQACVDSLDIAIKALEEIQQYRALGTVEELREAREKQTAISRVIIEENMQKIDYQNSLRECPFCGGELRKNMSGSYEDCNKDCILYGFEIHEKFIPLWNTRKPLERIVRKLKQLKHELFTARKSLGDDIYKDKEARIKASTLLQKELSIDEAIEIVKGGME